MPQSEQRRQRNGRTARVGRDRSVAHRFTGRVGKGGAHAADENTVHPQRRWRSCAVDPVLADRESFSGEVR